MSEIQKSLQHSKTLVLNADWIPIAIVPWYKAMGMLHVKKIAIPVCEYNRPVIDSKGREYALPAVVALKKMITKHYKKVPFNKKNVLLRDKLTCCYCNKKFHPRELTYDHVIPRCQWGEKHVKLTGYDTPTNWKNIVSACKPCNTRKGGRTPEEAGMKLHKEPRKPNRSEVSMGISIWERIPDEWSPYIVSLSNLEKV